jgi:hypothetical protein
MGLLRPNHGAGLGFGEAENNFGWQHAVISDHVRNPRHAKEQKFFASFFQKRRPCFLLDSCQVTGSDATTNRGRGMVFGTTKESKFFFFEKKKQKTFVSGAVQATML